MVEGIYYVMICFIYYDDNIMCIKREGGLTAHSQGARQAGCVSLGLGLAYDAAKVGGCIEGGDGRGPGSCSRDLYEVCLNF